MRISHEAIYQALYIQGRGALSRDLCMCLRSGRPLRVPRERARSRGKQFVAPEVMIHKRPGEVNERKVPGHWEGDLILGLESSAIGTVVERSTRYTVLLHLPPMKEHRATRKKSGPPLAGHGAEAVRRAPPLSRRRRSVEILRFHVPQVPPVPYQNGSLTLAVTHKFPRGGEKGAAHRLPPGSRSSPS